MTEPINDSPAPVAGRAEGDGVSNLDQQQPQDDVKFNEAWSPLLNKLPTNYRALIMPDLKQWDQNYGAGIQKVHSQYAPYKPFMDAQVAPETLNQAMMVYEALQEDPQRVIDALIEWHGGNSGEQGQEQDPEEEELDPEYDPGDDSSFDPMQHPDIQRYGQMTELMAQQLLTEHNAKLEAQEDAALDQELAEAKKELGDFDEDWVLQLMEFHQLSAKDAVKKYQEHIQGAIQNYRSPGSRAPIIAGGGGGVPSQQTPVKGLSGQDRRKLVQESLARALQGG